MDLGIHDPHVGLRGLSGVTIRQARVEIQGYSVASPDGRGSMSVKERGAITGIGETAYSRNSGKSVVALQMEASLAAIADAGQLRGGLGPRQVQGAEVAQYVPRRRRQVQEPDLHGGGVTMATARPVRAMDPYAEQF
jgi:hypothetical protein